MQTHKAASKLGQWASSGLIRPHQAWPGLAWPGPALACPCPALAWPGPGLAWPGPALPWPGLAWPALAWPGLGLGLAWPGPELEFRYLVGPGQCSRTPPRAVHSHTPSHNTRSKQTILQHAGLKH